MSQRNAALADLVAKWRSQAAQWREPSVDRIDVAAVLDYCADDLEDITYSNQHPVLR